MKALFTLLISPRGRSGRAAFMAAELVRAVLLGICWWLYQAGWPIAAVTILWPALWPGIVGTIKRFRDLGHDPVWILPVLTYLSVGFAAGYVYELPAIGLSMLGVYLAYVLGFPGRKTAPDRHAAVPPTADPVVDRESLAP